LETSDKRNSPPIHDNSYYRRFVIRPLAKQIAPILNRWGLTGNGVCWVKLIVGMIGAVLLVSTSATIAFIGMLLLQVNFLLDAADGEVSRLRGEAGMLSGEYLDKLTDHLPKTAMYFFWGLGTARLTGDLLPIYYGAFFAAWNIYPRFCAVETLLERLDKAPSIYDSGKFHRAVAHSFSINEERGKTDLVLTMFVHPAMNLLTLFFLIEIFKPVIVLGSITFDTRFVFLIAYTIVGLWNFIRKGRRFFKLLNFS